ncbi:hypothetical protein [Pseudoalteromonas ardens]|uniref:STAS/SEC14 domain-containing protein n=1 Tax=Pseudoalteromonas rubra TaxID=43658 RepID=A0A0L0EUR5_9GAMM|nr:hypothetical protein [Pseudoalteromonas sp. R96]KNC68115.1 hypothetical protein AC626_06730 [Pseudoalteromonas rubra]MDK1313773.1 hypothetical protein [Pseudoalteromonas sp. R96]
MFAAHGKWQIDIVPPVIFVNLIGAFNREGVRAFEQHALTEIAPYTAGALKRVVINLTQCELATADSLAALQVYFADVAQRGYQEIDFIGVNALSRQLLTQLWQTHPVKVLFYLDADAYLVQHPHYRDATSWLS